MSVCPNSHYCTKLTKSNIQKVYSSKCNTSISKHDAGCYSHLQMPELFFLNKKEQEKKNAPESNGSLVVGENQKVKVINSQEKIFFFQN